jgi:methylmalonyl-CoA mutase N-terminal domain/subunit
MSLDEIRQVQEIWEMENRPEKLPPARSDMGDELPVIYTPADIEDVDYLKDLGFPGQYPFTRGVYPGMYRKNPWQMRLYSGFGTAEDTNRRWKFLLERGNNGVAVAFDLPTQIGINSDHPHAEDEVGKLGVAIDTLRDMEILYEDLPLDRLISSFNINAPVAIIMALYIALGEKQGVASDKLAGTISNDILCEYVSRGMWVFPPSPALRISGDVVEYCARHLPRFYPFNIRGIIMREAGANMIQEAAFSFSNALAYIHEVTSRGLHVDDFARRISFFFATGLQIFEEAARYRAARKLWARIMKERLRAKNPRSMLFRFTGTTGGSYYRTREPLNNLVRGAYGLLGNILGGAQGMLHPAWDEPFAIPTEESAQLALRTQQILAYETGVTNVVDPLGGSYYVEALTKEYERRIEEAIGRIDGIGGAVKAIEDGFMQEAIANEAYRLMREEKTGERVVVGMNKFVAEDEKQHKREMRFHEADPLVRQRQIDRLDQVRNERDDNAVRDCLDELKGKARGKENLIPHLIRTVKTYASIEEIMEALKEVFGTFREPVNI